MQNERGGYAPEWREKLMKDKNGTKVAKVLFVLRDERIREASPDELRDNRIPPEVLEVLTMKVNGGWNSFLPDPLGR